MIYEALQELYEIADGAWGDSPWMRGLAVAKIREAGHPYPAEEAAPLTDDHEQKATT